MELNNYKGIFINIEIIELHNLDLGLATWMANVPKSLTDFNEIVS